MKKNRLLYLFIVSVVLLYGGCMRSVETTTMEVVDLTCEYLVDPLSVNTAQPRLAWKIRQDVAAKRGQLQTAYQILVASSPEILAGDRGDLWDSGRVKSERSVQVVYEGRELEDMQRCWWKVRVRNNYGEWSPWSEPACWGKGIGSAGQWRGQWIGDRPDAELRSYREYVGKNYKKKDFDVQYWTNPPCLPSPLLRKSFDAGVKNAVKRATLYVSALGYYEMWFNGKRVGDHLQAPEWTNYADHVLYQTYDLTDQLKEGENVLAATLADGWALGRLGGVRWFRSFPHRGFYALDRRLIAQLVMESDDGTSRIIPTDETWKINPDGYIRMADNFLGQTIDAGKIPPGWNDAGFDDSAWEAAYADREQKRNLVAQKNEPIRVHTEIKPVRIWPWNGKYRVDFGQNVAGHCALKIQGEAGQIVTLRHGEWLNSDSSIYTQSLGYAQATDTFILSGGEDYFDPSFTYHGFQYVEVSGLTDPLTDDMITARAVSSDPAVTGTFECSNPDLNRLYKNIVWTQRNNMFSVLHDNPSRDERTGAAGDIQIFCQSAIFNMDMAGFFTKFADDFKELAPNGQFFSMIPSLRQQGFWDGWIGAPGWCEAGLIVPWRMYENYADIRALESLYAGMKSHIEATWHENPDLIWSLRHNHNGDWLNANTIANPPDTTYHTTRGATPDDVFATAFFAYASRLLSEIAHVLQHPDDARKYGKLADEIKEKFIETFVHADGSVQGDTQGAYSLALYYDMIPEEGREKAFAHLVRCLEEYDYRLSTGFISTPMMMQLLVDFGRTDIAYRLLESTRFPSWLYLVKNGATTVWERWDAWAPGRGFQNAGMNSFDHVAFGSVSEWMFRHILGINPDIRNPGYKHFTIHPRPGGTLTYAKGSYNSIRGEICSSWKLENGAFTLAVTIPANTTATIVLPTGNPDAVSMPDDPAKRLRFKVSGEKISTEVGSGKYVFVVNQ
jgi:alpha-L-rhamnosidase